MPFYDYRCDCGNEHEEVHGMDERPVVRCDVCGLAMRKAINVPRINFNAFDAFEFLSKPRGSNARREFDREEAKRKSEARDAIHDLAATMEEE